MLNNPKISNLILRYGLALTYIFSGLDLILHPRSWSAFVPFWFQNLLPVDVLTYVQFQGVIELVLAAAFISGFLLRPAAFVSALEMLAILGLYGLDAVTFRDLAILGGSAAVFFTTFAPQPTVAATVPASEQPVGSKIALTNTQKRFRIIMVSAAFILFSVILIGLFWLSNTTKDQAGWLAFSYATGLSMIVLPCTLPLAFVIVPLAMGKDPKKGLAIAFAFAVGVTITLSMYGAIIAKLGQVVGLDRAKDTMYLIAGVFAVVFGLGELGLIKLRVPTYSGAFPKFIQDRKDAMKGLMLGLLLGNVGLGCPNPAFYVLLSHIATVGSMSTGWFLTFIHAVGRVTPLMLLAILGALGVDALSVLMKRREALTRATAWGVVGVGAFILTFGLLGHDWYVYSGLHSVLELVTQEAKFVTSYANQFGGLAHAHGLPTGKYLELGNWLFTTLIAIPLVWNYFRRRKEVDKANSDAVRASKWFGAYTAVMVMFLYLLFSITIPHWYRYQVVPAQMHEHGMEAQEAEHQHAGDEETEHEHEEGMMMDDHSMMDQVEIRMSAPSNVILNRPTTIEFQVIDKATGQPTTNIEISHSKLMHVVGVRKEDLTQFFHTHPDLVGNKFIARHTFTQPGTYLIWPGIQYQGAHLSPVMQPLVVGTPPVMSYVPAMEKTLQLGNDLVATLKASDDMHAGEANKIGFSITDAGGFDVEVGKYLEENMHINIISQDGSYYSHLHTNYGQVGSDEHSGHSHTRIPSGMGLISVAQADAGHPHAEGEEAPEAASTITFSPKDLVIQNVFPKAGKYKVFAEFSTKDQPDKVQLAQYWIEVGEPHGSTGSVPKWLIALLSVILIAAVMPFIFKYLNEDKIKVK